MHRRSDLRGQTAQRFDDECLSQKMISDKNTVDELRLTGTAPIPIAVIVVCRNALPALKETVESIKALGEARVLPIIVDGASTDGTAEWLKTMAGWAHSTSSEPDRGIYDAMNKAWDRAPEDALILFLGAGDLLYELPLDSALRSPSGDPWPLILGDTLVGTQPYRSRWRAEIRLRNTAHHQAMLLWKRVSPRAPFDDSLHVYADWDFNLRLYRQRLRARYVEGLRTYAAPGGASWFMDLVEMRRVAQRHSGCIVGTASWALNGVTRWRRRRRERSIERRA
jgi:glycosyltransferase involved in cell wall biosynthesis